MSEFSLGLAELGTAVSLDGLRSGIEEAEDVSSSGFDKIGAVIGGALTAGIAIAGAAIAVGIAAIVKGVGDAREANQLMAQTEAVITSTGGAAERSAEQIADLASSLSAASGQSLFGDSDIQAAENLLLTFTNIKGAVFDAATAISVDMAQALGGAPKDQAIALGKALNDPVAGITALTRVGVTFTEEQKGMIESMVKTGDVAGAQQVILAELNKEFGGSALAAAKADGGWVQFQDRMGEITETIGAAVLPILNQMVGVLNTTIVPAVESAAAAISEWLNDPATQANLKAFADTVTKVVGEAMEWLSTEAIPALQEAWEELQPIIADAMKLIDQAVIPTLKEIAAFIQEHKVEIVAVLKGAWDIISGTIEVALVLITGIIKIALALWHGDIGAAGDALGEMVSGIWDGLVKIISGALSAILSSIMMNFNTSVQAIGLYLNAIWANVVAVWGLITKTISDAASGVWATVVKWFSETKDWVVKTFTDMLAYILGLPGQWAKAGQAMIDALLGPIMKGLDELYTDFKAGLQRIDNMLTYSEPKDPTSPLRGLGESGAALVRNLQAGIDRERLTIDAIAPAMPSTAEIGAGDVDRSRTNSTIINFEIHTAAPSEPILQDIAMAQAMAQAGLL